MDHHQWNGTGALCECLGLHVYVMYIDAWAEIREKEIINGLTSTWTVDELSIN